MMKLLKEMLDAIDYAKQLTESKDDTVDAKLPKPRNKHVNDVLKSKKGGRHYDPKSDYKRSKEKEKVRLDVKGDE
jgi:hypothetical protein